MEVLFWTCVLFTAYTYVAYPLLVFTLSAARPRRESNAQVNVDLPDVCVIVAVYNEEERALPKAEQLLAQDYPPGKLRVLFVCDGCTDDTEQRLRGVNGIEVVGYAGRSGKPTAINLGLQYATQPVVVFCDVRQQLAPSSIRHLVGRLSDPAVGAVSGELVLRSSLSQQQQHIGLYWRYESFIRRHESRFASLLGATGALYSMRRQDCRALRPDTLLDDFDMPITVLSRGMRIVMEERAQIFDDAEHDAERELRRKVRTLTGNFQSLSRHPWLLLPWRNPAFWQLLSHKIFRLAVPYALVGAFISIWFCRGPFFLIFGVAQASAYSLAVAGLLHKPWREIRIVSFFLVFTTLNIAAVLAFLRFMSANSTVLWSRERR